MSIRTGLHIIDVLNDNQDITAYVGDRIYPVVVPLGSPSYPFITFANQGSAPDSTKDGDCMDNVSCSLAVLSKDYTEMIELGNKVRYAIDGKTGDYGTFSVTECEMTSWSEDYNMDLNAYVVTMTFDIKTIDY